MPSDPQRGREQTSNHVSVGQPMSPKRFAVGCCVLVLSASGATAEAEAGPALTQTGNSLVLQQPRPDPDFLFQLFLEVEGRYRWARAEPGGDFVGFETIDLSGAKVTAGISYLF